MGTGAAFCLLVAAVGALSATEAVACSYSGNSYDLWRREPLEKLFGRATFVERVSVTSMDEPRCSRPPPRSAAEEVSDRFWESVPEACKGLNRNDGRFSASVIERFRGDGRDRFELLGSAPSPGRPYRFNDIRSIPEDVATYIVESERARAAGGHLEPLFWFNGDVDFEQDQQDSCGGGNVLVPGQDYVVFRDRAGHVFAAEPVSRDDDAFLAWLRSDRPSGRAARVFTAKEAFEQVGEMSLARVERCEASDPEYDEWPYVVFARRLRGDAGHVFRWEEEESAAGAIETYKLDEWFAHSRIACEPMDLLIVETEGKGGYAQRVYLPPMPAVVRNGQVLVQDLFPGVSMTGPEWVTVDQAFAWRDATLPPDPEAVSPP